MEKDALKWTWSFSSNCYIDVYKEGQFSSCAHLSFDYKLKFHIVWSNGYLNNDEWGHVLKCVKEAKAVLKKLRNV